MCRWPPRCGRWHQLRWCDRLHLRRPHRHAADPRLPEVLRLAPDRPDRRPLLRADGGGRLATEGIFRARCGSGQPCGRHASDPRRVGLHDIPEPGIPRRGRGVVWWLARHRERFGGGVGYAIDPVCGMQVRTGDARRVPVVQGRRCGSAPTAAGSASRPTPRRYLSADTVGSPTGRGAASVSAVDPVCGMTVRPEHAGAHRVHEGVDHWFCCAGCAERFDADRTTAG